ncbi:hypothetical protein A2U01_0100767, partial [Trifolium medium]|nr:hypothetical protein [Trifolium medium]
EAKDLKKMSLETLISNLRSHGMVLNADASQKKPKSVSLQSTKSSVNGQEEDLEGEDFALFTRKFQQ